MVGAGFVSNSLGRLGIGDCMVLSNKKLKDKEIISLMTEVMLGNRGFNSDGLLAWQNEIIVVKDGGKKRAYLADENKVLEPIDIEGIVSEILSYKRANTDVDFHLDYDLAAKIARTYISSAIPIEPPAPVLGFEDDGYCFHRHPYMLLDEINTDTMLSVCPLFAEWIERVKTNREALIHFIGSIFVADSYNQQYLILKGSGRDGKGSLLQCLSDFFGPTFTVSYSDRVKAKEWTSDTYGKRVVAFPDAQYLSFANTEVFKGITGGDPVSYRFLYEKAFTGVSDAKFIICTNEDVDVTMMASDKRRRIFAEITTGQNRLDYVKELKEEAPTFFSWCRAEYLRNCDISMPIPTDESVEISLEDNSVDLFDEFFDQYLCNAGSCRRSYVYQLFYSQFSKSRKEWRRFKTYLAKYHNAEEKRLDGRWRFTGVSVRALNHSLQKK